MQRCYSWSCMQFQDGLLESRAFLHNFIHTYILLACSGELRRGCRVVPRLCFDKWHWYRGGYEESRRLGTVHSIPSRRLMCVRHSLTPSSARRRHVSFGLVWPWQLKIALRDAHIAPTNLDAFRYWIEPMSRRRRLLRHGFLG